MDIDLPINSKNDDFGFYIKNKKGYFSSNTINNDDIFSFTETKPLDLDKIFFILKGKIVNLSDDKFLPKININLINSNQEKISLKFNDAGAYNQQLDDTNYTLELIDEDYELVTTNLVLNPDKYSQTVSDIVIKKKECRTTYSGIITNKDKNTPLKNIQVLITDLKQNVKQSVFTDDKGFYEINAPCDQKLVFRTVSKYKDPYYPYYIEYMLPTTIRYVKKDIAFKEVDIDGLLVNEKGELLIETKPILFDSNKFNISSSAKNELNKVFEILRYNTKYNLIIKSHTDNKGTEEKNMILSQNRAKSTFNYLIAKGIPKERLSFEFFGETMPLIDCKELCSDLELSKNRRSEFEIKENNTP